jgi:nicotinamidase-related amidase
MLPVPARAVLDNAAAVLAKAREAGVTVIHIVVRFRDGYPEISPRNKTFSGLKAANRLREGTPGAELHPRMAAIPGEQVVTKRRVGAFSTTELATLLRAKGIENLVLLGIVTSGVVLSTVRWAADMDYALVVVADACADRNEDVHRMLVEKVFPGQATVIATQALLAAL